MAKSSGSGGRSGGGSSISRASSKLVGEFGGKEWEKNGKSRVYVPTSAVVSNLPDYAPNVGNVSNNDRGWIASEIANRGVYLDRVSGKMVVPSIGGKEYRQGLLNTAVERISKKIGL